MFYFLPAAGAGKTDASTSKNRLPEDSAHVPVFRYWQQVPVAGTGNRSVCTRLYIGLCWSSFFVRYCIVLSVYWLLTRSCTLSILLKSWYHLHPVSGWVKI